MTTQIPLEARFSRRQLLKGAGAAAVLAAASGGALGVERLIGPSDELHTPAPPRTRYFHSRPDLRPTGVSVASRLDAGRQAESGAGLLFLGPGKLYQTQAGPLMIDNQGEPVWFRPISAYFWEANFRPWTLYGRPVLAWWEGTIVQQPGYGKGELVIVDDSYREIARIRPANGRIPDLHELQITPQNTVIFTCYPDAVAADLTAMGGPDDNQVLSCVFQEIDIRTGRLLLEWRSLDHIPPRESYLAMQWLYDYLHINSIDIAPDGNFIVSARHTWTVYKLDRRTGEVIWRLGGKHSDFAIDKAAQFSWQHDARQVGPNALTIFDDGTNGPVKTEKQSRGLTLDVDFAARTARLRQDYLHAPALRTPAMGSLQQLAAGRVLVGWGNEPYASEFNAQGELITDLRLPTQQQSYRYYRLPWTGRPLDRPAVAARRGRSGRSSTLYASWNGSTEHVFWTVMVGQAAGDLRPVGVVARRGFETSITLPSGAAFAAVVALDATRRPLARSDAVRI